MKARLEILNCEIRGGKKEDHEERDADHAASEGPPTAAATLHYAPAATAAAAAPLKFGVWILDKGLELKRS